MGTVRQFEDFEVWKAARVLANLVYDLTDEPSFRKDFGLRDQLRRAAVSVLSNIAEGFERGIDTEFCRFLVIAKGSAGEVRAQLYLVLDRQFATEDMVRQTGAQAILVSRHLSNFIAYLKRSIDDAKKKTARSRKTTTAAPMTAPLVSSVPDPLEL